MGNWYTGSFMEHDLCSLHHQKNSRQYFEEFKKLLRNKGITIVDYDNTKAQVFIANRIAYYFVGSETWWGVQINPIRTLQQDNNEVRIILFANNKENPHYYVVKAPELGDEEKGRITFAENGGKLSSNVKQIESDWFTKYEQDQIEELFKFIGENNRNAVSGND